MYPEARGKRGRKSNRRCEMESWRGQGGATPNTAYWITEGRLGTNQNVETSYRITRSGRNSPRGAANGVPAHWGASAKLSRNGKEMNSGKVCPTVSRGNDASS